MFIAAVGALKGKHPSVKAILCGAGPLLHELKRQAQQLGLENNITFTGEITHEETLKHMQRSRVFFHPSSYEGFSGACLEALYAGAHVVSFFAPMHAWIRHWHVVENQDEAIEKIDALLRLPAGDNDPVLPYRIEDSAREMLRLFGHTPD
jgi:glycosyltransferase involved in cell wall biosynthesis